LRAFVQQWLELQWLFVISDRLKHSWRWVPRWWCIKSAHAYHKSLVGNFAVKLDGRGIHPKPCLVSKYCIPTFAVQAWFRISDAVYCQGSGVALSSTIFLIPRTQQVIASVNYFLQRKTGWVTPKIYIHIYNILSFKHLWRLHHYSNLLWKDGAPTYPTERIQTLYLY